MSRQYFIPGQGYINETRNAQYFVPGWGYVNETQSTGSVGSSTGTGAATGVGNALAPAAGSSSGTGAASGVGAANFAGVGSSAGVGVATGVAPNAGSVGSAAGDGEAAGVGASTAVAVGSSAGAGVATGAGSSSGSPPITSYFVPGWGCINPSQLNDYFVPGWGYVDASVYVSVSPAVGSASGAGSAQAISTATAAAVGSAAGVGTAQAMAPSYVGAGSAAGVGSAQAVGASMSQGISISVGIGAATGIAPLPPQNTSYFVPGWGCVNETVPRQYFVPGWGYINATQKNGNTGNAPGVGAAAGVGASATAANGVGSAVGVGSAQAFSQFTNSSVGNATGDGEANAVGGYVANSVGNAFGIALVNGTGSSNFYSAVYYYNEADLFNYIDIKAQPTGGVGVAIGTSDVNGVGNAVLATVGLAAGVGVASAVGSNVENAVGSASGMGTASGVSSSTSPSQTLNLPAGYTAVYSVLKLTGWTGNCCVVQRASDSTQFTVGWGTNNFADFASAFAWAASSVIYVVKWFDQSGNGWDATGPANINNNPLLRSANIMAGIQGITMMGNGTALPIVQLNLPAGVASSTQNYTVAFALGTNYPNAGGYGQLGTSTTVSQALSLLGGFYSVQAWSSSQAGWYPYTWIGSAQCGHPSSIIYRGTAANTTIRFNGYQKTSAAQALLSLTGGQLGAANQGDYASSEYFCVAIYPTAISDTLAQQIDTEFESVFGVTPYTSYTSQVLADGDSITAAFTGGNYGLGYFRQAYPLFKGSPSALNNGIDGTTVQSHYTGRATMQNFFNSTVPKNVAHAFMGTNDLQDIGSSGIVGYGTYIWTNYMLPYILAMQSFGYTGVVVGTMFPRAWTGGSTYFSQCETERAAYNALIISNAATYGYTVADYASLFNGVGGNPTAAQYYTLPSIYSVDGIHPTPLTCGMMAPLCAAAVNTYL